MIKVQARVCHVWAILAERGRETWWSLSTSDIKKTGALCKFSFKANLVAWRLTGWGMLFFVRGHYSEQYVSGLSSKFREIARLGCTWMRGFQNICHQAISRIFCHIEFSEFSPCNNMKKDDLVLLGWSLQSPLHVGNNHDEEEDEIWSLIHYVRCHTVVAFMQSTLIKPTHPK